ncbi:hypothetical protein DICA1_E06282 [Diutina catenulata]
MSYRMNGTADGNETPPPSSPDRSALSNTTNTSLSNLSMLSQKSNYESAVQNIEQEKKMVAALKRLSLGHMMNYDPDVPMDDIDTHNLRAQFDEPSPNLFVPSDDDPDHPWTVGQTPESYGAGSTPGALAALAGQSAPSDRKSSEFRGGARERNSRDSSSPLSTSPPVSSPRSPNDTLRHRQQTLQTLQQQSVEEFYDAEDSEEILQNPNSLLWVPATAHPEIDPEQFKSHVKNKVDELSKQITSADPTSPPSSESSPQRTSGDVKRHSSQTSARGAPQRTRSTSSQGNKRDSVHSHRFSNPSLRDLTSELEKLSKLAGMDATDAVTLARTLSTSSIGYTDVERLAIDEMTSKRASMVSVEYDSDEDWFSDNDSDTSGGSPPPAHPLSTTLMLQQRLQMQFQQSQLARERELRDERGIHRRSSMKQSQSADDADAAARAQPQQVPFGGHQRQVPGRRGLAAAAARATTTAEPTRVSPTSPTGDNFALKRSRRTNYKHQPVQPVGPTETPKNKQGKLQELRNNLLGGNIISGTKKGKPEAPPAPANRRRARDSTLLFSYRNPNDEAGKPSPAGPMAGQAPQPAPQHPYQHQHQPQHQHQQRPRHQQKSPPGNQQPPRSPQLQGHQIQPRGQRQQPYIRQPQPQQQVHQQYPQHQQVAHHPYQKHYPQAQPVQKMPSKQSQGPYPSQGWHKGQPQQGHMQTSPQQPGAHKSPQQHAKPSQSRQMGGYQGWDNQLQAQQAAQQAAPSRNKQAMYPYATGNQRTAQLSQNLDLLRSEINEFKESLTKNDHPAPAATAPREPERPDDDDDDGDFSFKLTSNYPEYEAAPMETQVRHDLKQRGHDNGYYVGSGFGDDDEPPVSPDLDVRIQQHEAQLRRQQEELLALKRRQHSQSRKKHPSTGSAASATSTSSSEDPVQLQNPPSHYRHQPPAQVIEDAPLVEDTIDSDDDDDDVGNTTQIIEHPGVHAKSSPYPSPTLEEHEPRRQHHHPMAPQLAPATQPALQASPQVHPRQQKPQLDPSALPRDPPATSTPKKLKKKKSFGILGSTHAQTSPAQEATSKKLKKKKSWPWLRERSVSASSVDAQNLPPVPDNVKIPRSVSNPEEKPGQTQRTSHDSGHSDSSAQSGHTHASPGKENMITKLFKKKKQAAAPSDASIHSGHSQDSASSEDERMRKGKKMSSDSSPRAHSRTPSSELRNESYNAATMVAMTGSDLITPVDEEPAMEARELDYGESAQQQYLYDPMVPVNEQEEEEEKENKMKKLKSKFKKKEPEKPAAAPVAAPAASAATTAVTTAPAVPGPQPASDDQDEEKPLQSTLEVQEKLRKSIKRTSKANQPIEFTDSAFGFPLPPPSHSTLVMLDYRFPVHVERAIYRLSHLKLANPKRSLREQVLLSNFMYAYLNLVDHTLHLEQQMNSDDADDDEKLFGDSELGDTFTEEDESESIPLDLDDEMDINTTSIEV